MGTMTLPARSAAQRFEALERANRIRSHRAAVKRDLKAGRKRWSDLLDDSLCQTMRVWDVLMSMPKMGRVRVNRALRHCGISPSKTLAGLTPRQRGELAEYLR
jgi:hypothetical protein